MRRQRLEGQRHTLDQARCSQKSAILPGIQEKVQAAQLRLGDPSLQARGLCTSGRPDATKYARLQDATGKDSIQQVAVGHVVVKEGT